MPNLTPEKELEILAALKAKFQLHAINVITDEPLFDSKHDVLDTICVENVDGGVEVVYCKLALSGFQDSATDGCDDMPVVFLTYTAHLFWGYTEERRSDGSTSENDLKKIVLDLRNKFLEEGRELVDGCEHAPLVQSAFIILGDDPFPGVYGHFVDLTCRVEVV